MLLLGWFMLLWSIAIWPFIFRFTITTGSHSILSGSILMKTIGLSKTIDWKLISTEKGLDFVLHFTHNRHENNKSLGDMRQASAHMKELLQLMPSLKQNMLSYLSKLFFTADIRLGLSDAAATALTCASLSAVLNALPHIKGYVTPDFRSECLCLNVRCIAAIRLGTLFVSAALGLGSFALLRARQIAGGVVNGSKASD